MYKHLKQEKTLLQEKLNENKMILDGINRDIAKFNDEEEKVLEKEETVAEKGLISS